MLYMRQKTLAVIVGLVVIVIALFAFVRTQKPAPIERTVKIGYFNQHLGSVPLFLAEQKGLFAKHGVKVELVPIASSNQATDALVRNDIDLGIISMIPVLNAESKDSGKIKLVSASVISKQGTFDSIVVKSDSGIESLRDAKVKKVAVFPGTTATNFLKTYLKSQGIDPTQIEFVQMPPQNQLAALQSGAVQAAHMLEPTLSLTLAQSDYKRITGSIYASAFDQSPIGGYGMSAAFANQYPELAKQTVLAVQEASAYELAHPDEARQVIVEKFAVAPEVAAKMSLLPFARFEDLAPNFLGSFVDLLMTMGEVQTRPNLDGMIYRAS